jgi:hypothetical protein
MEATMSAKAIAILSAAIVLFASNAVSQDPTIVKSQLGFRIPEIESFFVERAGYSPPEVVLINGENENFILTDIYFSCEGPGAYTAARLYRNSARQMEIRREDLPVDFITNFHSGLAFHPGDTLKVQCLTEGRFFMTLSGYFFNE